MKKYIFIILSLFMFISKVNAEACDYENIKRLKEVAEGVEITYELMEPYDVDGYTYRDTYKINITGLTDEIIACNETDEVCYNNTTNFNDIVLDGGVRKIVFYPKNCSNVLKRQTLKLPVYNDYFENKECKKDKFKNMEICQEWTENKINYDVFYKTINSDENNYENNDFNIINFVKDNIIFVGAGFIIFIILLFLLFSFKKKKGVLE